MKLQAKWEVLRLWLKVVAEGEIAPDFTLQTDDGSQISLSDYKGKTVVLYFYPKDETPGCTTEALGFSEAAGKFEKEGAVILGVSKDSVESHQKFKKKHGLPFTLLSDPEGKVLKLYNVWKQKNFTAELSWAPNGPPL